MRQADFSLCLASVLLVAAGCAPPKDYRTYDVSGSVKLDNKPLKEGEITFVDPSGGTPVIMTILDGKFEGKARAGKFDIEIRAFKLGKKLPPGPGVTGNEERPRENYIPERYNTKTKFKGIEVKPEGNPPFDYQIQSD